MHYSLYTVGGNVEEPACLYYLKRLVEHRSGIDGDLVAHIPVGMTQCVGNGNALQLPGIERAERATGGGYDKTVDRSGILTHETLVDRRMLGVDRVDA